MTDELRACSTLSEDGISIAFLSWSSFRALANRTLSFDL